MEQVLSLLNEMDGLDFADFFRFRKEIAYIQDGVSLLQGGKYALPHVALFLKEEAFADIFLGWNEGGIFGAVHWDSNSERTSFLDYRKGDAVELFFDTRDYKEGRTMHAFCHAFVLQAGQTEGVNAWEISRFRQGDSHPLCDPAKISLERKVVNNRQLLQFFLPAEILHGYDPTQFQRLGFAYKIYRHKAKPMHYPFSSKHFEMMKNPHLWATFLLSKY